MTPEKQDKTSELSKHWSPDSTLARNVVIMKTTYSVNQESATKSAVIMVLLKERENVRDSKEFELNRSRDIKFNYMDLKYVCVKQK